MFEERDRAAFKAFVALVAETNEELRAKGLPPVVEYERSGGSVRVRFADGAQPAAEATRKR